MKKCSTIFLVIFSSISNSNNWEKKLLNVIRTMPNQTNLILLRNMVLIDDRVALIARIKGLINSRVALVIGKVVLMTGTEVLITKRIYNRIC